jgi:hypothetical protein
VVLLLQSIHFGFSCSLIAVFTAEWNHQPCDLMKGLKSDLMKGLKRRSGYYGIAKTLIKLFYRTPLVLLMSEDGFCGLWYCYCGLCFLVFP